MRFSVDFVKNFDIHSLTENYVIRRITSGDRVEEYNAHCTIFFLKKYIIW